MSSNEPTEGHQPSAAPAADDEEMAPPARAVPVPERQSSALGTSADPAAEKSKSWLQRHGIASILSADKGDGRRDPNELPDRSPVGAVRQHSGVNIERVDTEKVKSEIKKREEAAAGVQWHLLDAEQLGRELDFFGISTRDEEEAKKRYIEQAAFEKRPPPTDAELAEVKASLTEGRLEAMPAGFDIAAGLTTAQAEDRIKVYGLNQITPKESMPMWMRFLLALTSGFAVMMIVGSILSFIVFGIDSSDIQSLTLALMLFIVTIVTAMFQAYQEGKADNVMEALRKNLADNVMAIRDGEVVPLKATHLVPGDVVECGGGDKVPADVRILQASDLKVNNASLTGENVDIKLGPDPNHTALFEAKNIARSGCNFTNGKGRGLVFATGDETFFGQIAFSTTQTERPDTLMKREVHRLIMFMGIIAAIIGIVFLSLSFAFGYHWSRAVVFTIGIIVANVPEGLLPQLTVALALTAKRLMKKDVLVTCLEIIETLGAVTVICSDKTGTLTCNRMTVAHCVYDGQFTTTPEAPAPDANDEAAAKVEREWKVPDYNDLPFAKLARCAALCSDAKFMDRADPEVLKWTVKGDASESAIVKFVQRYDDLDARRNKHARLATLPFNSTNKFMVSINNVDGKCMVLLKGAPERIFDRCGLALEGGASVKFDAEARDRFEERNKRLGRKGQRVLAFAELELPSDVYVPGEFEFDLDAEVPNIPMSGFTLLGLISMIDPPRKGVLESIEECHAAGIKVFMVTGDHPVTAVAISRALRLINKPTMEELEEQGLPIPEKPEEECSIAIHGTELAKFEQKDWDRVLKYDQMVFARTMPQQKQDIVKQLTAIGHIVAMTGDGVNDAPALKAAHVGVAMGSGAQVAKEAAQIVVLEDDFSSIVDGVREGRTIFENMKKAISYVLISNIPQIVPFLIFIAGKLPLAMETLVILCIDLGTDILPAIALAYEEPEGCIMQRPPRGADDHLVSATILVVCYGTIGQFQALAMLMSFAKVFTDSGWSLSDLVGAGPDYRANYDACSADQRVWFEGFCKKSDVFKGNSSNFDECREFRLDVLEKAQAAAFLSIVWGQLGNLIARKTIEETSFTMSRLFDNTFALVSVLIELFIVLMLTHVPGLNQAFGMRMPESKHAAFGLWVMPLIIVWEEGRKWIIRNYPESCVSKITRF